MAMRLSELLERIRPAGTPGSADSAESNLARALTDEIAPLVAVLRRYDDEVGAELDDARARADTIRADGERRAALIRDGVAERVAAAAASVCESDRTRVDDERRRVAEAARAEIERRRANAEAARERLADRVLETIRELADDADGPT